MTLSPRALADLLPDEPRWIDLRGLLLNGRCNVWAESDPARGFVSASWDFPFAALWGEPSAELITAAVAWARAALEGRKPTEEWQLLALPEARPLVEAALPGWRRQGIALHRWEGGLTEPDPHLKTQTRRLAKGHREAEIRLLRDGHRKAGLSFDGFPESSRNELALDWVSSRPMAAAIVDSRPVAYCWAAFTTERHWDVAVETAEPFRRRGLAAACFRALAAHMATTRKSPTWGAMLDNPASLGLAAKLGFVRDAMLDGWTEPGADAT